MYDSWDIQAWRTEFFVILGHFLPFEPRNNTKNHNLGKMKKKPGDIIILHFCITNDDHMMYGFWDMELDRQIFSHFGLFFALLTRKIKILKKWKKFLEISFYTNVPSMKIICMAHEIWSALF